MTVYTALIATGAAAGALAAGGTDGSVHWFGAASLLVTLIVAGAVKLQFHYGRHVEALDVFEAVLAPAIFALPAPLAVAAVALAKLVSELWTGVEPVKARFNAAQWAAAAAAGALVFRLPGGEGEPTAPNLALLSLAMIAVSVVNHLAVVGVLRLTGRRTTRQVLADLAPVVVTGWVLAGLLYFAFGLIFVAAWSGLEWVAPLFLVPLGLLHWANRGYAEARADRSRLAGLQQATRALLEPVDPRSALPAFLAEVRLAFEVSVAELVLADGDGHLSRYRVGATGEPEGPTAAVRACDAWQLAAQRFTAATPVAPGSDDAQVACDLVGGEPWQHGLVAPVRCDERVVGFLCVHERVGLHGFAQGELAVLDVLAAEVAGGLRKGELLDTVLQERRQLSEIVNQTSDGIATLGLGGRVLSWNPGFAQLSGHSHDELQAAGGVDVLEATDPQGRPVDLARWIQYRQLPQAILVRTRAGGQRWLDCSYTRVRDAAGRPERLIVIARDVTESRMLQEARDELREAGTRLGALRESEERVRVLLRNASDVVAVLDGAGTVTYASQGEPSRRLFAAPHAGQRWLDVVHPDDRARVEARLGANRPEPGASAKVEHRVPATDGGWRTVETVVTNLLGQPPVDGIVLNSKDVTERKQAEAFVASETEILGLIAREEALGEVLRRTLASLQHQLPGVRSAVALVDAERIEVIGGADLTPLDRTTLAQHARAQHAGLPGAAAPAVPVVATGGVPWALHPLTASDGSPLGFLCLDQPDLRVAIRRRLLRLFAGLAVVAIERDRSRAQLTHRATHDALTALPNRSMFLDRLATAVARTSRLGTWVAVLYCDLDGFKAINDGLGHDAGDQLLVAFGQRLLATVRPGDTAARLGGDEFTVLCEDLRHPTEAAAIAERLRDVLAQPFDVADRELVVTPSIGVAVARGGGDPQQLLERADAAMYRAKRDGGARWELTELAAPAS